LRYFAAVAGAGTFTRAAEQMFIAQPTLSQQIRRLEQIVGTPLLQRLRDGVRLTAAGTVLLHAARDVLSLVDHAVSQTRQTAGLGRQRLRVAMPPLCRRPSRSTPHPRSSPQPQPRPRTWRWSG
jgi:DNA-binding transcriptional LysR family regulator